MHVADSEAEEARGMLSQQSDDSVESDRPRQTTALMRDLLTGPTLPQLIYVTVSCCFLSTLLLILKWSARCRPSPRSVAILVLGDVGRSPRMMYHAESFAKLQFETFLVGYQGNVTLSNRRCSHCERVASSFSSASLQALNRYLHCSLSHMSTFCTFRNSHLLSGNSHS